MISGPKRVTKSMRETLRLMVMCKGKITGIESRQAKRMEAQGLIVCVHRGRQNSPGIWEITDAGRAETAKP